MFMESLEHSKGERVSDTSREKEPTTERTPMTLREWLEDAPFSLVMSSGFFGFFAHCGMLSVLEEEGLLPQALAGASAGALVAGCWAAGLPATSIRERLLSLKRSDFWDPGFGFGLLRGRKFQSELGELLPVTTFEACRVPLRMSLYDVRRRTTVVRSEGPLIPAIHASCAVPFLFQPVRLDGRLFLDGGVSDRPGLAGVPDSERVLFHHLASRSPWRRKNSPSLQLPKRDGLTALVIHDLPRVNPFRLERGKAAFHAAREATQRALSLPVQDGAVHLSTEPKQLVAASS